MQLVVFSAGRSVNRSSLCIAGAVVLTHVMCPEPTLRRKQTARVGGLLVICTLSVQEHTSRSLGVARGGYVSLRPICAEHHRSLCVCKCGTLCLTSANRPLIRRKIVLGGTARGVHLLLLLSEGHVC